MTQWKSQKLTTKKKKNINKLNKNRTLKFENYYETKEIVFILIFNNAHAQVCAELSICPSI